MAHLEVPGWAIELLCQNLSVRKEHTGTYAPGSSCQLVPKSFVSRWVFLVKKASVGWWQGGVRTLAGSESTALTDEGF